MGCFKDDKERMFSAGPSMIAGERGYTGITCANECCKLGFTHFSLQSRGFCFCGNEADFDKKNGFYERKFPDHEHCEDPEQHFEGYRGGRAWRNSRPCVVPGSLQLLQLVVLLVLLVLQLTMAPLPR